MPTIDFSLEDAIFWVTTGGLRIAAGIASFRRSRCLSRYPLWQCILIGLLAWCFTLIWFVNWAVNRKHVAAEWARYRRSREVEPANVR